jgi:hypothetical protein
MTTLDRFVHPATGVVGQVLEREAVVILPLKGQVKVLNEVGALIWSLIDGTRSIHDIAVAITTRYDVDPDVAEADTLDFVTDLVSRGMVTLERQPIRAGM